MRTDLTEKYRPSGFKDLWNQGGTVQLIMDYLCAKALPKVPLFWGNYGTGKTSLARVIARSLSCLNTDSIEPCGECGGCIHYLDRFMGQLGGAMIIQGNKFDPEALKRFSWEASHYMPPECSNTYVLIVDEFQRLSPKEQETLLHIVEDTPRTHFIICTSNKTELCDGILARAHEMFMNLPTPQQAEAALKRIAQAEEIEISAAEIARIVRQNNCVPRNCLKGLQTYFVPRQNRK